MRNSTDVVLRCPTLPAPALSCRAVGGRGSTGGWFRPNCVDSLAAMTGNWPRRGLTVLLAAGALVGLVTGPSLAAGPVAGAKSAGDPYFPLQGNGGYDVGHYGLTLDYRPASGALTGVAQIRATATHAPTRFPLGPPPNRAGPSVPAEGHPAFSPQPPALRQKLVTPPAVPLAARAQ